MSSIPLSLIIAKLGITDYQLAYDLQRRIHAIVAQRKSPDVLLLLQHPHVFTHGRRGTQSHILAPADRLARLSVQTYFTDRGGETTYHGPGQIVGYPIVNLRRWGGGVREYVHTLESALIGALAACGIAAHSEGKPTGVWVGDAKIAAIGVRVSRGATLHGFALNVCPDLSYFDYIVPCGMPGVRVTSMSQQLGRQIAVADTLPHIAQSFAAAFGMTVHSAGNTAPACANINTTPDALETLLQSISQQQPAE